MSASTTIPAAPDQGVDRKVLKLAVKRFRGINSARLERVRSVLPERQLIVMDSLPLLFHVNHPMLPGYVSHQTPAGVTSYRPGKADLDRARNLARSFSYQRQTGSLQQIHGIYLMGSTGTIAHSGSSDLDIWVCYPESLSSEALALLARKTQLIEEWATQMGVEAHMFLMCGDKFRSGQRESLTGENCGTAQHYLLLDEFYRTGILLAGRFPIWWLVPPSEEYRFDDYARTLRRKRYIRPAEGLDFGGIDEIPAGEFVGAGIWQLYKAIDSPYKSVLKLLLTEVYASEAPDTRTLSALYKEAIYHGVTDIDQLDPYVMVYRKLEQHLLELQQPDRLEMVRRCFYYKAAKRLSRPPFKGVKSWQRILMEKLVEEWGWQDDQIKQLDSREHWNINDVIGERQGLVSELTSSYRFLSDFARANAASTMINSEELSVLGRKLYAAFERKAGKIDIVNAGRASLVTETELSVCQVNTDNESNPLWGLYPESVSAQGRPTLRPLRVSTCLTELLAWAELNGVVDDGTSLQVRESLDGLRYQELNGMLKAIRQHLGEDGAHTVVNDDAFTRPAYPVALQLFVNVATDPLGKLHASGFDRLSDQTDSLGYSGLRENLVHNIESILHNSWGEVVATRYCGTDALLRCIKDYLHSPTPGIGGGLPDLDVHCFCPSRAGPIGQRVRELFSDLSDCYFSGKHPPGTRYLIQIESQCHLIQYADGMTRSQGAAQMDGILDLLSSSQRRWNSVVVDRYALQDTALPAICEAMQESSIMVCLEAMPRCFSLLIVDELGSFYRSELPADREQCTLHAIHQFLTSVVFRQNSIAMVGNGQAAGSIAKLRYYRIEAGGRDGGARLCPIDISRLSTSNRFTSIQAIAGQDSNGDLSFSVFVGALEFDQRSLGEDFFSAVADHILSLRRNREVYPFYITDLDLSALIIDNEMPLQSSHYFRYRAMLEDAINAALRAIAE